MRDESVLDSIEDGIKAIKKGEIIIVVDDENRENEGDFICASEVVTPGIINFMATYGKGLICTSLLEERCDDLGLDLMVGKNTASHQTAFTVSVDLISDETSTGISAQDRAKTIKALVNPETKPSDLGRPGHVFPLKAKEGGVLRRTGHTEAAIDFARLAGFCPSGVLVEIMKDDGTMARLPDLKKIADKFDMKLVSIQDLISYRIKKESLIEKVSEVDMPTEYGAFTLHAFKQINTGDVHVALVKGTWEDDEPIMVRVHSSCVTGDIFGSFRCDCGEQLHEAMRMVDKAGKGIVVYMNQEGRGIGLANKLKAYELQEKGYDTVEANHKLGFKSDLRDYGVGAQILRAIGASKIRLITNNPQKRAGLSGYELEIIDNIPLEITPNKHNIRYLTTKRDKMGHDILKHQD